MSEFVDTRVRPFYLNILHGNYALFPSNQRDPNFVPKTKAALKNITPEVINTLFAEKNWRPLITAAWFCGLKRWHRYEDHIGESLLENRFAFAGQSYCFALANFATTKSSDYLVRYLDIYLPQTDRFPDQLWAMGALLWIDEKQKTTFAHLLLAPGGLWDESIEPKSATEDRLVLEDCKDRFYKVMNTSIELFG